MLHNLIAVVREEEIRKQLFEQQYADEYAISDRHQRGGVGDDENEDMAKLLRHGMQSRRLPSRGR
jgi:hypothetical protein